MSTFDDERRMQVFMDKVYHSTGWGISRNSACKQFDCELTKNGKVYRVEEKFLFCEFDYKQGLIEIMQDLETADLGWFYHVVCDFLFWVYCPSDRHSPPRTAYVMKWAETKPLILKWMVDNKWYKYNHCPENYGLTLNYPVKWSDLDAEGVLETYHYEWNCSDIKRINKGTVLPQFMKKKPEPPQQGRLM